MTAATAEQAFCPDCGWAGGDADGACLRCGQVVDAETHAAVVDLPDLWVPALSLDHAADYPDRLRRAARAYAAAGWYVLPVLTREHGHAGRLLGKGWPEKTTRDPKKIDRWFSHSKADLFGLALHVGRSGAVCFDVDVPANMPPLLRDALRQYRPAFQGSRADDPEHGHYLFALPEGVTLGNGVGRLRTDPKWGEVRGTNGIIVVEPSQHGKGGRYRWQRETTGALPTLPTELLDALTKPARVSTPNPRACSPMYAEGRIRGLLDKLMAATEGERNTLLYWTACRFGEMVERGFLDEATASRYLTSTAAHIGLTGSEVVGTVASGLDSGQGALR